MAGDGHGLYALRAATSETDVSGVTAHRGGGRPAVVFYSLGHPAPYAFDYTLSTSRGKCHGGSADAGKASSRS